MKTFRISATLALLSGLLWLPARIAAAEATPKTTLQMQVETPFIFDVIHQDDVAEALFFRVKDGITAKHRGVEIKQLEDDDEADAGAPVLTLTLINWRITHMGDIECRFRAEYRSADGTRPLGVFEGTTSSIARSRTFVATDFERAAEEAGRQLGEKLSKQGLI